MWVYSTINVKGALTYQLLWEYFKFCGIDWLGLVILHHEVYWVYH
jgi:hypothetical protein